MRIRLRRRHQAALACATMAAFSVLSSAPAHAAAVTNPVVITALDRQILNGTQMAQTWGSNPATIVYPGSWLSNYCSRNGFGNGMGQCRLLSFYEEQRVSYDRSYQQPVTDPMYNCTDRDSTADVTWSHAYTTQTTLGASVSVSLGVTFNEAPLGMGATETVTTTVGASWSYAWGTTDTISKNDRVTVSPGRVGWLAYATDHGTAHGVASVEINQPPSATFPQGIKGYFQTVVDLTGDLPKPIDPNMGNPQNGIVTQSRAMTPAELSQCLTNPTAHFG
ncbi:hypothetical protein ACQPXS_46820 (plasmid) [Streptomyces sp. CA-142005]|uniref:hypothetical protein n=1 Tax=Streptomyces sp. CA-142005 TaxID=3240052 RepID=UPI003D8AED02